MDVRGFRGTTAATADNLHHVVKRRAGSTSTSSVLREVARFPRSALEAVDDKGRTALHVASDPSVVAFLLYLGANPDAQCARRNTPLHVAVAARRHSVERVNALLVGGAKVSPRNGARCTPVHIAAFYGNVAALQVLLEADAEDCAAAAAAAAAGSHDGVAHGGTVHGGGGVRYDGGDQALPPDDDAAACQVDASHPRSVVDMVDIHGNTPLHCAVLRDHADAIDILVDFGASLWIKNDRGLTPLDLAQSRRRPGLVKTLRRAATLSTGWDLTSGLAGGGGSDDGGGSGGGSGGGGGGGSGGGGMVNTATWASGMGVGGPLPTEPEAHAGGCCGLGGNHAALALACGGGGGGQRRKARKRTAYMASSASPPSLCDMDETPTTGIAVYDEIFNQPSFALEPRPKRQKRVFGVWQGRRPTEDGVGASDPNGYLDLATASTTVFEDSGGGGGSGGGSESGRSAKWGIRGIL